MKMKMNIVALKISFFVCGFIVVVLVLMTNLIFKQTKESLVKEMSVRAEFFARGCKEALFPKIDEFSLHFQLQEMSKEKAIVYVAVQDTDGRFISHSQPDLIGEIEKTTIGKKALSAVSIFVQEYFKDAIKQFDIAVPVIVGSRKIATVRLGFTDKSVRAALTETKQNIVLIAICIIALSIVGTTFIVEYITNPLKELVGVASIVGKGNFDVSVKEKGRDEIGLLSKAFNQMVKGLKERETIKELFGEYVSPEIADAALKGEIKLGGEKKIVTVLLSDIRDFTVLSEKIPPEKVVELLNIYLSEMVKIIIENNGCIDKFIGDAIFAVFGAPLELKNHTVKAMECAFLMREKLLEVNRTFRNSNLPEIKTGIAIHTGEVIAGNIGSKEKLEYTSIGDTVNTVTRMERLNREWKTSFLISEQVYDKIKNFVVVKSMPPVLLRGKGKEITLYEVVSKSASASLEMFKSFEIGEGK